MKDPKWNWPYPSIENFRDFKVKPAKVVDNVLHQDIDVLMYKPDNQQHSLFTVSTQYKFKSNNEWELVYFTQTFPFGLAVPNDDLIKKDLAGKFSPVWEYAHSDDIHDLKITDQEWIADKRSLSSVAHINVRNKNTNETIVSDIIVRSVQNDHAVWELAVEPQTHSEVWSN